MRCSICNNALSSTAAAYLTSSEAKYQTLKLQLKLSDLTGNIIEAKICKQYIDFSFIFYNI